jgi:CRP-like cAMP-binding protein
MRAEETQDEFRAAAQATAYYEKIYAKFEEQDDENSAKYPSGFSQEAIGLLTPEPADRDIIQLKKVFKELRTTTFFQALPDERQDTSYWLNILKKAILRPDLQAETVLYDSHDSPCRTAGKGRKDKNKGDIGMSTLFIVLAGGVQVIRDSSDSGSLLSSGDAFGAGALDRLTDPKSAVVFCNDTCLLEISADIMTRAHAIKMNDYLRFLKSTRLFANTPEEQLAQIVPLFQLRKYWSNEVIVKQGEISSELFIIASGCVRVVQEVVVPYNMPRNGYITTPSEIMEPVSSAAVATLAHVKQARFSVKSCARDTAKSAGMILGGQMAKVLTSMEQADINLLVGVL